MTTTTPLPADESTRCIASCTTPVLTGFAQFLASSASLIAAERDLAGYSGQDPAVDAWIRGAEQALQATRRVLDDLGRLPAKTPADLLLKQVAAIFRFVMLSDDPVAVDAVRHHISSPRHGLAVDLAVIDARADRLATAGMQGLVEFLAIEDAVAPHAGESVDSAAQDPASTDRDTSDAWDIFPT